MATENNLDYEDDIVDLDDDLVDQDGDHDHDDDDADGPRTESRESDDGSDDSRVAPGEEDSDEGDKTDEEREEIRARRRQERQERRRRAKEREERYKADLAARDAQIAQMQQQLAVITGKTTGAEVAQLDQAIKNSAQAYEYYKTQLAEGTKVGDGSLVADATEKMFQSRQAFEHYNNIKKQYLRSANAPSPIDSRVKSLAEKWASENRWYDPAGGNIESRVAKTIDDALVQEGYNPATELYWEELSKRVKKFIPSDQNLGYNRPTGTGSSGPSKQTPKTQKSTVVGSSRNSSPGSTGTYQISAERKQALQDAGLWDDPKLRAEAIKRYKEYDKSQGKRA